MTQLPPVKIEWEPVREGTALSLVLNDRDKREEFLMPMMSVRELRDDMEEASFLSRGYTKEDLFVNEVDATDLIVIGGNAYQITNLLESAIGWVIQFQLNEYLDETSCELILPKDLQITVWRLIE